MAPNHLPTRTPAALDKLRPNGTHQGTERYDPPASNICDASQHTCSATGGEGKGPRKIGSCSDRTDTQNLNQIHLRAPDPNLILISIPILKEDRIQLEHLVRLRSREQELRRGSPITLARARRIQPMGRPRLHPDLAVLGAQHPLTTFDLDAQTTLEHPHVLLLVGVEVRGRFPGGEGDQLRVLQLEGHFEGEGTMRVGDYAGLDCAVEAGAVERRSVG